MKCRLEYAVGVDALRITLLVDAYSYDWSCTCVNLKLNVNMFEQQCYHGSAYAYMFVIIISGIGTASLAVYSLVKIKFDVKQIATKEMIVEFGLWLMFKQHNKNRPKSIS